MAYRDIWRPIIWPPKFDWNNTTSFQNNASVVAVTSILSQQGHKGSALIRIQRSGVLKTVHWLNRGIGPSVELQQWPAAGLKFSLQDVAAGTWTPTGTPTHHVNYLGAPPAQYEYFSPGSLTADGSPSGAKRQVIKDEYLHVAVEFIAAEVGDYCVFGGYDCLNTFGTYKHVNVGCENHGSWDLVPSGRIQGLVLEYDDGSLDNLGCPTLSGGRIQVITSSSTPNQLGNRIKFSLPARLVGMWTGMPTIPAIGNRFEVYDDSDLLLAVATWQGAHQHPHGNLGPFLRWDNGLPSVDARSDRLYRFLAVGAVGSTSTTLATYPSAAFRSLNWEVDATEAMATWRKDAGPWTDSNNEVALVFPVIDGIDPAERAIYAKFRLRGTM